MYRPNSIQSRLTKEDDPGHLLQEVNDTIESLQLWKEEQKKLDEALEKMISDRRMAAKVEIDEETSPDVEIKELTTKDIKCQQGDLIKISNLDPPTLISIPDINTVNNFELYKAGSELNEILQNWNSSLDFLMGGATEDKKEGEDWNKISEIEKELEELEELMESVPNLKH